MKNRLCSRQWKRPKSGRQIHWVLIAVAILAFPQICPAGVPDWMRAAARAALPAYPDDTTAVVLFDENVTTVKDNGEIETIYRRGVKILRTEGQGYGLVAVDFDSDTRLTYLKGWSISARGDEYELKEKDAVETALFSEGLYSDTRHKLLRLPAVEVGAVIAYEYVQKHRTRILQDTWSFQSNIPVLRARYILKMPVGWEFSAVWLNYPEQVPRTPSENEWVWELENLGAVESEPSMPPWRALAGRLALTFFARPNEGDRESHDSWHDVGAWYAGLTVGRREATPEIRQKVAELTASVSDDVEKLRIIASFVQREIRYVAVEIGIGGHQPHPAAEVFANRYGDCKDKVTLLSTMLREIGVESYYVLIHHDRGVLAPEFPSMLSFDHAILAIRVPEGVPTQNLYGLVDHGKLGPLLFFDPTDRLTPLGYLPATLQANYGLLVTEDSGDLLKLPLLSPVVNRLLRSARLELSTTGSISGEVQEIRWGVPASRSRAILLDAPESEQQKVLEDFLGNFLGSLAFEGSEVKNLEDIDQTLVVEYRFWSRDYAKAAGNLLLVKPRVLGEKSSDLLEGEERKHPVVFPAATLHTDIFEIALPAGYEVDEIPEPVEMDFGFAEYKSEVTVEGKVLHYRRNYAIKDVQIPTERLEELKDFYRRIAADERSTAVLKRITP